MHKMAIQGVVMAVYNPLPLDTNCTISSGGADTNGTTTIKSSDEPTIFGEIIFTITCDQENSITAASTAVLEGPSSRPQHFICGEGT